MGILNLVKGIISKINKSKTVIAKKAQIQTERTSQAQGTMGALATKVGNELITPTTVSGVPVSVVEGADYRLAGSTAHVRGAELSGIYFNDVLELELETSLRTQYRNSHIGEFVMVPNETLDGIIDTMGPDEIQELVDSKRLVPDPKRDGRYTMTVETYRAWQHDRTVAVREIAPTGVRESMTLLTGSDTFSSPAVASTCRAFYLDDADTLRIAERFGGGTKGVLNKYAQQADIPVPILAVCAIMSVVDKNGNPVPLINEDGKITQSTYLAVRQALDGDPLVGFLDEFTGYSVDEKGHIKPGRSQTFGSTGIQLGSLREGLYAIVDKYKDTFKIHPNGYLTSYKYRTKATRIDSQCDGWIQSAVSEYRANPTATSTRDKINLDALNAAAVRFARDVVLEDSQVQFINRRQRNLLRTVMGNQTTSFKTYLGTITTTYERKFNELTIGDVDTSSGVVGESSHKFTAPKPFDEAMYTADYAMLKDNILLVNSVQLGLSRKISELDGVDLSSPEAADAYIKEELGLEPAEVSALAEKYGIKIEGTTQRERVEQILTLHARDQVAQIILFNQTVVDIVKRKEDLRVCEHTMGQIKFQNLTAVEDMHKLAVERITAQQQQIVKGYQDKIKGAKTEIDSIRKRKAAAVKRVKELTSDIERQQKAQETIARGIIGGRDKHESPIFTVLRDQLATINGRNGKGFDTKNPSFKKLVDSHITRILRDEPIKDKDGNVVYESIYNKDGTINQDALSIVVGSAVTSILNANQARAEGLPPGQSPRIPVKPDSRLVATITASIVTGIMTDPENTTLATNAGTIQALIDERTGLEEQINGSEAKGIKSFDTLISDQQDVVTEYEGKIKGIKNTPEEQKQLVNAEKHYYGQLATVKIAEFTNLIETLNGIVNEQAGIQDLIDSGVLARNDQGAIVIPENSIIRTLADANNPQILTDFEAGLSAYGQGCAELSKALTTRIAEIQKIAFNSFDIVIDIQDNKVVGTPRHIDNPLRVKGDIDPRVVELYDHQSKIDRYRQIMNPTTDPKTRLELLDLIPDTERAALGIGVDGKLPDDPSKMTTYLEGRIQAELEASDKIRLAYASMGDGKEKFRQDYVRYVHYVEGQKDPSRFIDADQTRSATFDATVTTVMVDDSEAMRTLFAREPYSVEVAGLDERFMETSQKEQRKPKVKGADDIVEEDVDVVVDEEEQHTGPEYATDAVAYQEAFDNRSFIAHILTDGMTNENRLATVQAFKTKFPERAEFFDSLVTAEGAVVEGIDGIATSQEEIMDKIASKQGDVNDPEFETFVQEVVAKHFNEIGEKGKDYTDEDVLAYETQVRQTLAKQQQLVEDKKKGKTTLVKPVYTASGCQDSIKALKKQIAKLEAQIKSADAAAAAAEQQAAAEAAKKAAYERGLLEKGYLSIVAEQTKPVLSSLTGPQIAAIIGSVDQLKIEGETLATWRECVTGVDGVVDEDELIKFIESELGVTIASGGVVVARQLQSIADSSVLVAEDGQIVNGSGINVTRVLYERIDNAAPDTELTSVGGRDAILYAALRGIADRDTVQARVEEMYKLFKDNGIEITPETIEQYIDGTLTFEVAPVAEGGEPTRVPARQGAIEFVTAGLNTHKLVAGIAPTRDTGMGS